MLPGLKFDIDPEVFNYETEENNCFCEDEGKDNNDSEFYDESNEEYEENSDEYDPWGNEDEDEDPWSDDDENPWGDDEDEEETKVKDSKDCSGKGLFHLGSTTTTTYKCVIFIPN